ncbi:MAG: protein meaA [Ferrimicrobium sp.]|jgi:(2R)-ethylmalonyl-CoA mutase|nr:protein meaA [Ferrimicrobium sp.]
MSLHLSPPDPPWVMRTYAGHSSARASNQLFRTNLANGQTGLSVAFDLPTQLGLDPDDPRSRGEVGKVGVPIAHLGHMRQLFDGIALDSMNTSMTINATAMWLFSLYLALADETGIPYHLLAGTTQNDIIKEYLSRGTFIFTPEASRRLTVDLIEFSVLNVPKWNPINICSYHLQEAGATPVQEVAYALATAVGILDAVRDQGRIGVDGLAKVVGRMSFFVNAGIRFLEEIAKMRAFVALWDEITRDRYGVGDPKLRRFRFGVQVNSLGLTESQPENNVYRIVLEALGVTLSRDARARALQLPAWNEAIGLPRPVDQQWSLRAQQILAYETDILSYPDIFEGSIVMEGLTTDIVSAARQELDRIIAAGGVFNQIDEMKAALVRAQTERAHAIETKTQLVVGVNIYQDPSDGARESPLVSPDTKTHLSADAQEISQLIDEFAAFKRIRDQAAVTAARRELLAAARTDANLVPATLALARAGGTTQDWADTMREAFGEFRAPTGIHGGAGVRRGQVQMQVLADRLSRLSGNPARLLVAKPGLDGHSNGAEQIAVAARDAGFEVIYQGIRQTPDEIASVARDEDVDLIGLSILSGSHLELVEQLMEALRALGLSVPVVLGGIIPDDDIGRLKELGVRLVFTPKHYQIAEIMEQLVELVVAQRG